MAEAKTETKADVLLHPVRLRVIQVVAAAKRATAQQVAGVLTDVPPATLYRHLAKLADSGILHVAETRQVRGAIEKVYALDLHQAVLSPEDLAKATPDDHMRYFTTFVADLLAQFARYVQRPGMDLVADGVSYRTAPLYLSEAERTALTAGLRDVILPALENQPAQDRRLYTLSTILLPNVDATTPKET